MLKKVIIALTLLGALSALIIVNTTTPATIPPLGLLVFFICVYLVFLGLMALVARGVQRLYKRFSAKKAAEPSLVSAYEYASVMALGPTILLALQTVGRLQFTDVLFTALFVALGCFYIAKRNG